MNRRRALRDLGLSAFCLTRGLQAMDGPVAALVDAIPRSGTDGSQSREKSIYHLAEFRGTARECGRAYGHSQSEALGAFLYEQLQPDSLRLEYAERCGQALQSWEKPVFEFIQGIAEGSGRPLQEILLLSLHEEVAHARHCTAIGATREGSLDGSPIIGQNWDWTGTVYPWASLLRLHMDSAPATLTYAYPGLWACAGMNEHGLSLVWTSSGLYPKVRPDVGIPTYALIAGIFTRRTCREAITLLRNTRNAGSFIFVLADAGGEVWVVEGVPGKVAPIECKDVITRANHFVSDEMCGLSKQDTPAPGSVSRANRMAELAKTNRGRISPELVATFLRDHGATGVNICHHPERPDEGMTLDSFYLLPANRQMWMARGLPCRHIYEKYAV